MGLRAIRFHRERRQFVRVPFAGTVRAALIPPPVRNPVWHLAAEDLSEGGVRLACGEFCSVECGVLLDLDTPSSSRPIRAVGKVVWVAQVPRQGQWRVGVRFTELSDAARSQLRALMQGDLAAESRHKRPAAFPPRPAGIARPPRTT
ncbi:MAG: PilZ domain-containing protein [Chromatiaceae bacterium]